MGNYKKYSDEFKQEVLAMVAAGERSVSQIERDLDITPGLIYKWQQRYGLCRPRPQRFPAGLSMPQCPSTSIRLNHWKILLNLFCQLVSMSLTHTDSYRTLGLCT